MDIGLIQKNAMTGIYQMGMAVQTSVKLKVVMCALGVDTGKYQKMFAQVKDNAGMGF